MKLNNNQTMFVRFQRLRMAIPEIKTTEVLNNLITKFLDKKHVEYNNLKKGLNYEWRAYWYVNAWLNKKNFNYSIFLSDLKSDLKGIDLYAVSNKENDGDKANVEFRFQIKPKGQDIDAADFPLVTHFILVGKNFIQVVKRDNLNNL